MILTDTRGLGGCGEARSQQTFQTHFGWQYPRIGQNPGPTRPTKGLGAEGVPS
jgi:hypothetical protein